MADNKIDFVIFLRSLGIKDTSAKAEVLFDVLNRTGKIDWKLLRENLKFTIRDLKVIESSAKSAFDEFEKAIRGAPSRRAANRTGQTIPEGTASREQLTGKVRTFIEPQLKQRDLQQAFRNLPPPKIDVDFNTLLLEGKIKTFTNQIRELPTFDLQVKAVNEFIERLQKATNLLVKEAKTDKERLEILNQQKKAIAEMEGILRGAQSPRNRGALVQQVSTRDLNNIKKNVELSKANNREQRKTTKEVIATAEAHNKGTLAQHQFSNSINTAIGKLIRYRVTFFVLRGAIDAVKQSIKDFIDIQFELANLEIVLDSQTDSVDELKKSAFDLGKKYGGSIQDIIKAMKIWAQTGLKQNEINKATEATLIGMNALGATTKEVTEALTAAIFTYGVEVEGVTQILSKWLAVQREFPISAQDLANSLKIVGAAAKVVGVDLDDLTGYIAAIGSITRKSGAAVGQSLKTMFARLPRAQVIRVFERLNIAVQSSALELRDLDSVLIDLSKKWEDMSSVAKANLAVTFGGIRRYADFIALMDNFEVKLAATIIAQRAQNEAMIANQLIVDTLKKRWETAQVAITEFSEAVGALLSGPLADLVKLVKFLAQGFTESGSTAAKNTARIIAFTATFVGLGITLKSIGFLLVRTGAAIKTLIATFVVGEKIVPILGIKIQGTATALKELTFTAKVAQISMGLLNAALLAGTVIFAIWAAKSIGSMEKTSSSIVDTSNTFKDKLREIQDNLKATRNELLLLETAPDKIEKLSDEILELGIDSGKAQEKVKSLTTILKAIPKSNNDIAFAVAEVTLNIGKEGDAVERLNRLLKEHQVLLKDQVSILEQQNREQKLRIGILLNAELNREQQRLNLLKKIEKEGGFQPIPDAVSSREFEKDLDKTGQTFTDFQKKVKEEQKDLSSLLDFKKAGENAKFLKDILDDTAGTGLQLNDRINRAVLELQGNIARLQEDLANLNEPQGADTKFFIGVPIAEEVANASKQIRTAKNNFENRIKELNNVIKQLGFGETVDIENFLGKKAEDYIKFIDSKVIELETQKDFVENVGKVYEDILENLALKTPEGTTRAKELFAQLPKELQNQFLGKDNQIGLVETALQGVNESLEDYSEILEKIKDGDYSTAIKLWEEVQKKAERVLFTERGIEKITQKRLVDLDSQVKLLSLYESEQEHLFAVEKERLKAQYDFANLKLEKASLDEAIKRTKQVELANQYYKDSLALLKKQKELRLAELWSDIAENAKIFREAVSGGFRNIPSTLVEGVERRADLAEELRVAEFELQEARKQGDEQAISDAQYRLDVVNHELEQYKKGWFEIKTIVTDVLSNLGTRVWEKFADQVAEDIAEITIGGDTLGKIIGDGITQATDEFEGDWKAVITDLNTDHKTKLEQVLQWHVSELSRILQIKEPLTPLPGEAEATTIAQDQRLKEKQLDATENNTSKLNSAVSSVTKLITAMVALSASISLFGAGKGAVAGSQFGGILGLAAGEDLLTDQLGKFAGPVGTIFGTIFGGFLGSLFDSSRGPLKPLRSAVQENTDATIQNTLSLKELDKSLFNAPTRFAVPSRTGGAIQGNVNININSNQSPKEIADEVMNAIKEQFDEDSSVTGTRRFVPN